MNAPVAPATRQAKKRPVRLYRSSRNGVIYSEDQHGGLAKNPEMIPIGWSNPDGSLPAGANTKPEPAVAEAPAGDAPAQQPAAYRAPVLAISDTPEAATAEAEARAKYTALIGRAPHPLMKLENIQKAIAKEERKRVNAG